jgi:hypothetical protein
VAGVVAGLLAWLLVAQTFGDAGSGLLAGLVIVLASFKPYMAAERSAKELMKSSCCTPRAAVRYTGWYGSMHTFEFDNKTYMESFLSANYRKTRSDVTRI